MIGELVERGSCGWKDWSRIFESFSVDIKIFFSLLSSGLGNVRKISGVIGRGGAARQRPLFLHLFVTGIRGNCHDHDHVVFLLLYRSIN